LYQICDNTFPGPEEKKEGRWHSIYHKEIIESALEGGGGKKGKKKEMFVAGRGREDREAAKVPFLLLVKTTTCRGMEGDSNKGEGGDEKKLPSTFYNQEEGRSKEGGKGEV